MGNIDKRTAPRNHGRNLGPGSRGSRGDEREPSRQNRSYPKRDWIPHSERSLSDSIGDAERSNGDVDVTGPDRADDPRHASAKGISERPEIEVNGEHDFTQNVSRWTYHARIRAKSSEPRGAFLPIGATR